MNHPRGSALPALDGVTVRPMRLRHDLDAVLGLQEETYRTNFPGFRYGPRFLREFEKLLRMADRAHHEGLFVAEIAEKVVGFLWVSLLYMEFDAHQEQALVKDVCVTAEMRRRGIGRLLMQRAEEWGRQQGATKVTLQVTAANQAAIALYEGMGYAVERYHMGRELAD